MVNMFYDIFIGDIICLRLGQTDKERQKIAFLINDIIAKKTNAIIARVCTKLITSPIDIQSESDLIRICKKMKCADSDIVQSINVINKMTAKDEKNIMNEINKKLKQSI